MALAPNPPDVAEIRPTIVIDDMARSAFRERIPADKLTHFLSFGLFGGLATLARLGWFSHFAPAALWLTIYGAAIERLQAEIPNRHAEISDLMANMGGVLAGAFAGALALTIWRSVAHRDDQAVSSRPNALTSIQQAG